jgi:ubiquinone/menaquinone biosynthesis C-methylase UbiE
MTTSVETKLPRAKKASKGLPMEGFLARWYARNTAKNRESYRQSAEQVAAQVGSAGSILEVAPGPGYLAIDLARMGNYRIVGLDISHTFVELARRNAQEAGVDVTFEQGNVASMPFKANSFDFIVCRAAFKNFSEPVHAIEEMYRVLQPGGRAQIIDLRPDVSTQAINAEVKKMGLKWYNSWLTRMVFKHTLIKRAYSQEQFRKMAAQTSFKTCDIQEDPVGMIVSFTRNGDSLVNAKATSL